MPPQRTPLRQTDGNWRPRGCELTPYERGRIEGTALAGISQAKIADVIKRGESTIHGTLALEILRTNGAFLPRKGRPPIYNERD